MISSHGDEWPGMTRMGKTPCDDLHVYKSITKIPSLIDRKIILLATATITDENIFSNGLFQNVFFLLRMFDAMGCLPILVVNQKPQTLDKIPEVLRNCRILCVEDLIKQPIPIYAYIEIGMSVDTLLRKFLKLTGARICKLYLGNILNIDIETPIFYPGMHFAHHVIGELQEIWVSPHYLQHAEYACALNHVDPDGQKYKVAPYVWDSSVLMDDGKRYLSWQAPKSIEAERFIIMEPNISFQKTSLIPLLLIDAWYRKHKDWNGKVTVVNGERIHQVLFFKQNILPLLDICKDGKVEFIGRKDMVSLMKEFPSATFVCNQINNEYNYMLLELLWAGFPVIHNAKCWSEFGYYYEGNSIVSGEKMIELSKKSHHELLETYKSHARTLAWRHSPYNPDVHRGWKDVLHLP